MYGTLDKTGGEQATQTMCAADMGLSSKWRVRYILAERLYINGFMVTVIDGAKSYLQILLAVIGLRRFLLI